MAGEPRMQDQAATRYELDLEGLWDAINVLLTKQDESMRAFAPLVGVPQPILSKLKAGHKPSADQAITMLVFLGVLTEKKHGKYLRRRGPAAVVPVGQEREAISA